jgi:cysteine synthase A
MTRGRGFFADQFENEANWRAHHGGTGPELYAQCNGHLDAFVAGAGTGGTISGVARFLKPLLPKLTVVLADPQGSGLFNRVVYGVMFDVKEREGTRRRRQVDTIVEGIGINRVTANFEVGKDFVDDAVRVTDAQALAMARWLVEKDGIFVGSSSAVNCEFFFFILSLWMVLFGLILTYYF